MAYLPTRSDEAQQPPVKKEPLFRLVRGVPTDAELAALTVVLLALNTALPAAAPVPAPVESLAAWRQQPYRQPVSWQRAA
ncbi:acyl-CoA carboxylase subunit epsilon [Streptomyces sp. NPDC091265]|uniref:acyl-CoA carboxylase subunit epsilon n=1 Tax=unclassified Streptomyces TaxID=2593676 RepID=UPI00344D0BCF